MENCYTNRDIERMKSLVRDYRSENPTRHNPIVYNFLLKGFMGSSMPEKAYAFFDQMVKQGYQPIAKDIYVLLEGLLKYSYWDKAHELMDCLGKYNLKPNTKIMNVWIRYYVRDQQIEKAKQVFKSMESMNIKKNCLTFLEFISYLLNRGDYEGCEKLRSYMRKNKIKGNLPFYNGLIWSLLKKQAFDEANYTIAEMKSEGIKPNEKTYNLLIKGYASVNDRAQVSQILKTMGEENIPITTATQNIILGSLMGLSVAETKGMLVEMTKKGLVFNDFTYYAIIEAFINQNRFKEAIDMLFEIERKNMSFPLEIYSKLLCLFIKNKLDSGVMILWQMMQAHDMKPNSYIISSLLKFLLRKRKYNQVNALMLQMQRHWKITPNAHVCAVLLNHYVECLDFEKIDQTVTMMRESKVEINNSLYNVLTKIFYSYSAYSQGGYIQRFKGFADDPPKSFDPSTDTSAIKIDKMKRQFEDYFKIPFKATVHIYNEMMLKYFMKNHYKSVFKCFLEMRNADIMPNSFTFTVLIKAQTYEGEYKSARKFLDQMIKIGINPNLLNCAIIFHSACRALDTEFAESFFEEVVNVYHLKPNHIFYGSLLYAYNRKCEYPLVFKTFERLEKAGLVPDTETCNYVIISLVELGNMSEAKKFFKKMLIKNIPRNSYTYIFMSQGYLHNGDYEGLKNLLSDVCISGNTINSIPFCELLHWLYVNCRKTEMLEVFENVIDWAIKIDDQILPYINAVINRHYMDVQHLKFLRKIIQKAMVDLELEPNGGVLEDSVSKVIKSLISAGMHREVDEFKEFQNNLPQIQQLWNSMKSETIKLMSESINRKTFLPSHIEMPFEKKSFSLEEIN